MKTTFITTVLNEEKTIEKLLQSLSLQTKKADEIIIIDAGSTDKTVELINNYISHHKEKIKIFIKKGNRAEGRNEAIKKAKNDIILVSDAGCIFDKNWIKNISKPFIDKDVDVVSGYYKPIAHNTFQKCLSTYTCVMPDKVDPDNFLPSSRSIAFKKNVWEKIGGYPETLDTCEDLVFASKLKKKGYHFVFAKEAIVYWPQRKNLSEAFRQFFTYAKGDGKARYFRSQTPLLFLRYILGIGFVFLFIITKSFYLFIFLCVSFLLYLLWAIIKNYRYVKQVEAFYYLPLLQITADIAVILGTSIGFLSAF